jgi:hypothetical protein
VTLSHLLTIKLSEALTPVWRRLLTNLNFNTTNGYHQMKMIRHQAPGQYIGVRQNTVPDFIEKKQIVLTSEKYRLRIISTIIYMIDLAVAKFHDWFLSSI